MSEKLSTRREFLKKAGLTVLGTAAVIGLDGCTTEKEHSPKNLVMDFGPYGRYKTEWDKKEKKYTLGWWESNMVEKRQKDLTDLKIEGGKVVFYMPFDGTINNSAGEISIDQEKWNLGNPAIHQDGSPMVLQGQLVELEYSPMNDSAGFQIYFEN